MDLSRPLGRASERSSHGYGAIDEIKLLDAAGYLSDMLPSSRVPAGCNLYVRGWAVAPCGSSLAGAVLMVIDSEHVFEAVYGLERPDVATVLKNVTLTGSGFRSICPLGGLVPGGHTLSVRVVEPKSQTYHELDSITFEIVDSNLQMPSRARLSDDSILIAVDPLQVQGHHPPGAPIEVNRADIVVAQGWAFDVRSRDLCEAVYVVVDNVLFVRAVYGFQRADVAKHLRTEQALFTGLRTHLSTNHLAPGIHHVRVAAVAADSSGFCESGLTQEFLIS
jgi:hypothetical protein